MSGGDKIVDGLEFFRGLAAALAILAVPWTLLVLAVIWQARR